MPKQLTYYLYVLGCQMNKSDAERLETILQSCGYTATEDPDIADFIGVVSCAVKQAAMDRIYTQGHKWNLIKEKRPLITMLTGCVLKHDKEKLKYKFDILLDMKDIQNLPELLRERNIQLGDFEPTTSYLSVKPQYESEYKAYVPIMTGCNKFCTFCAVPYTRGPEISRPSKEIFEEIKHLIAHGYKEITLLGQNVNSYGNDRRVEESMSFAKGIKEKSVSGGELTFPELLHEINSWDGDFWIRFVSSHPYDMSDELINVLSERKHLTEYFHLAVQSGSDKILKRMNRHHTTEHFLKRLEQIREHVPGISISTDIIVGFPGETEKEFQETIDLMNQAKFDMAYISQYSPRPGTGAARAHEDDVSRLEKKKRDKKTNKLLEQTATEYNQGFIGKKSRVLIDAYKDGSLIGKNRQYKTVKIKSEKKNLIGEFIDVEITKATAWGLSGKII